MRRFDFDAGLAPYDLASYGQWRALSDLLTPAVLERLSPAQARPPPTPWSCVSRHGTLLLTCPDTYHMHGVLPWLRCNKAESALNFALAKSLGSRHLARSALQLKRRSRPHALRLHFCLALQGAHFSVTAEADPALTAPRSPAEARLAAQLTGAAPAAARPAGALHEARLYAHAPVMIWRDLI